MRVEKEPAVLVLPRDILSPSKPDEHFADEWTAAIDLGFEWTLVDHDAAMAGATAFGHHVPAGSGVYRGWMLPPTRYMSVVSEASDRALHFATSGAAFERCHQLPGWYEAMQEFTPESVWTTGDDIRDFDDALQQLEPGPVVVKDFSKSEKHHWDEAMFIPDASDRASARTVAARFRELRDTAFDGGFVLRRFETFVGPEARTWWVDGRCVLITAHPDSPTQIPTSVDVAHLVSAVQELSNPFVAIDVAQSDDGQWRVVEVGDGQVSDRPRSLDARSFIAATLGISA